MKIAKCSLESSGPYSQSKVIISERGPKELHKDFEKRAWKERTHVNGDGEVFIPPMQFANSIKEAAKYLSISIPGQRQAKYTKNFESGIMVLDPLMLNIQIDDIPSEWLFVPSDGKPGGGKRVWKCFPLIKSWKGVVSYYIIDDIITQDVFDQVLRASGLLIGIGRFRPRNRGYYGRFKVKEISWTEG